MQIISSQLNVQLCVLEIQAFVHRDQNEKRNSLMLHPSVAVGAGDIAVVRNLPDISISSAHLYSTSNEHR